MQFKMTQALQQKHDIFFMHKNSHANFMNLVQRPICIYYVEIVFHDILSTYFIHFISITETL